MWNKITENNSYKALLVILLLLVIVLCIISVYCTVNSVNPIHPGEYGTPDRFILIDEWQSVSDNECRIYYDSQTNVMYLMIRNGYFGGLSPLYNSDGSVMIYEKN